MLAPSTSNKGRPNPLPRLNRCCGNCVRRHTPAMNEPVQTGRALLRRAWNRVKSEQEDDAALRFESLVLDPDTRAVHRGGRPIELTPIEFSLLELFLRNPRKVLTRAF